MTLDFLPSQSATAPSQVASGLDAPIDAAAADFQQGLRMAINPQVGETHSDSATSGETLAEQSGVPTITEGSDELSLAPLTPATATRGVISLEQQLQAQLDAAITEFNPLSTDITTNSPAVDSAIAMSANGQAVPVDWAEPAAVHQHDFNPLPEQFEALPSMPSGTLRTAASLQSVNLVSVSAETTLPAINDSSSTVASSIGTTTLAGITQPAIDEQLAAIPELTSQATDNSTTSAPAEITTNPTSHIGTPSPRVRLLAVEQSPQEQTPIGPQISTPETDFAPLPSMLRSQACCSSATTSPTNATQPPASIPLQSPLDSMVTASKSDAAASTSPPQGHTNPSPGSQSELIHAQAAIPATSFDADSLLSQDTKANSVLNPVSHTAEHAAISVSVDATHITAEPLSKTTAETSFEVAVSEQHRSNPHDHSDVRPSAEPHHNGALHRVAAQTINEITATVPQVPSDGHVDDERPGPQPQEPARSIPSQVPFVEIGRRADRISPERQVSDELLVPEKQDLEFSESPRSDVLSFAIPSVSSVSLAADLVGEITSAHSEEASARDSFVRTEMPAGNVVQNVDPQRPTTTLSTTILGNHAPGVPGDRTEPTTTVRQVIGAMQQAVESSERLRVHLNPPELGTVMVEVSRTPHGLVAKIEFSNASTQQAVANSLPELHRTLSQTGIVIDRVEVTIRDQRPDSPERQPREERGRQQQRFSQQQQEQERQQRQQRRFVDEELDREAA